MSTSFLLWKLQKGDIIVVIHCARQMTYFFVSQVDDMHWRSIVKDKNESCFDDLSFEICHRRTAYSFDMDLDEVWTQIDWMRMTVL